jgi:hypothetical protein
MLNWIEFTLERARARRRWRALSARCRTSSYVHACDQRSVRRTLAPMCDARECLGRCHAALSHSSDGGAALHHWSLAVARRHALAAMPCPCRDPPYWRPLWPLLHDELAAKKGHLLSRAPPLQPTVSSPVRHGHRLVSSSLRSPPSPSDHAWAFLHLPASLLKLCRSLAYL